MTSTTDKAFRENDVTAERRNSDRGELPVEFLDWQRDSRLQLFETLSTKGHFGVKTMPSHLAVIASLNPDGSFNMATKGIGVVPKADLMPGFTTLFRETAKACKGLDLSVTLTKRMRALLSFYLDVGNMDNARLGGLEIFEGRTYDNLRTDPKASLLFTGCSPEFVSYQIDGQVEFVEEGDAYYDFLRAARELFARDGFHVPQDSYPHGFVFQVTRVIDKRPFSRSGGHV